MKQLAEISKIVIEQNGEHKTHTYKTNDQFLCPAKLPKLTLYKIQTSHLTLDSQLTHSTENINNKDNFWLAIIK